jgi:hypothetical protein
MNPWLAIAIFLLSVGDDMLAVLYVRRVNAPDSRLQACAISGLLTAMICLEVVVYTSELLYIVPNAIGSMVGTYMAMAIDDRFPAKKARDEKGKFKKPLKVPSVIVEIERGGP